MRSWRRTLALAALAATTLVTGAPGAAASSISAPAGAVPEQATGPRTSLGTDRDGRASRPGPDGDRVEPGHDQAASAGPTDDVPEPRASATAANPEVPDRYIVRFVDGTDPETVAAQLAGDGARVRHIYDDVLSGAAIQVPAGPAVDAIRRNPHVETVEPDLRMGIARSPEHPTGPIGPSSTDPPPWGLDRIDQRALPLSGTYAPLGDGAGVTTYVVDTGIRADHVDLGGRVEPGYTAFADPHGTEDCEGHGTHVAGTIGGTAHGIAGGVTLVPVRVLGCTGTGTVSGIIAGLDWIAGHHTPPMPAVANLSLAGPVSASLDGAVQSLIDHGVTVVVAAGNEGIPACSTSPARAPAALTVAATGPTDAKPWWSNHGSCVDLFAPGVGIRSAGIATPDAVVVDSGTSMAAPHVAGAAAVHLARQPTLTPAQVASLLSSDASRNQVGSVMGAPNRLLHLPPTVPAGAQPPAPPKPVNDGFAAATPMTVGGTRTVTGTNLYATKQAGEPNHAGQPGGSSVWWTFKPSVSGELILSTQGSGIDTLLAVYEGTSVSSLFRWAANDDASPSVIWSQVRTTVHAGHTYWVAVDGWGREEGAITLRSTHVPGPPNDDFGRAASFALGDPSPLVGTNMDATFQPGEPQHGGRATTKSVWWRFAAPSYGTVTLTTKGTTFDSQLAAYTGSSLTGLTLVAENDDHLDQPWSRIRFRVTPGTTYRVAVSSSQHDGGVNLNHAFTPATKPAAPTTPTVTRGDARAKLSWVKPGDGGATITGYKSRCVPRDTSLRTRSATSTGRSVTITSLVNGKTYYCQVRAQNPLGYGPWSPTVAVKPLGPPSKPLNLTHTRGDRRVALSWSTPASNGGTKILEYRIRCYSSSWSKTVTTTSRSITVTGLTNNHSHKCSVSARNAVGYGPTSTTPFFHPSP